MERIPANVFDEFAAEGMRLSAQHLRDLNPERRNAVLAATVRYLSRRLTDGAIEMLGRQSGGRPRHRLRAGGAEATEGRFESLP
jgi:hypothetical protein